MNEFKTLDEKRKATKEVLDVEKEMILKKGYNPITDSFMSDKQEDVYEYPIHPNTPVIKALTEAQKRLKIAPSTNTDITSVIRGLTAAAISLKYTEKSIKSIERRHIINLLDQCEKSNPKFSSHRRNKYRAYLITLFNELKVVQAVETNPVNDIPIRQDVVKKKRELLTDEERSMINGYLRQYHHRFWLCLQVFFHSGIRETEMMGLKISDVNLERQQFKVLIKKGKQYVMETKTIRNVAMNYWQQAMAGGAPTDYIFSTGLVPGPNKIRPDQITRRWKRHIKDRFNITKDFYSLKALNTDDVDAAIMEQINFGLEVGAAQNSHRSIVITEKHYAPGHQKRKHEILKNIDNSFTRKVVK
jgi:integrase